MSKLKPTSVRVVHGVKVEHTDKDNVERKMTFNLLDDDSYAITIVTKWPDEDEPFKTILGLTPTGLDMLIALINHGVTTTGSVPVTRH